MITKTLRDKRGTLGMKHLRNMLAFAALSVAGAVSAQNIRATVNGDFVNFPDVRPEMMKGRVMVNVAK